MREATGALRVLELGSYIAPAYAGMILAEQGHTVTKWTTDGRDPILSLRNGDELWHWINYRKRVEVRDFQSVAWGNALSNFDVVIDNIRATTLAAKGIEPALLALRNRVTWVSLRDDLGDTSFDIIAQARAWGGIANYVPFYIGDTSAGLWLAFKALAVRHRGPAHHVVLQATALAKLVEGELVVDPPEQRSSDATKPVWDPDPYEFDPIERVARVTFRGREYVEPLRDDKWRLRNLRNVGGRFLI